MMKPELPDISPDQLSRYLDGLADEHLQQNCETILAQSSTVVDPPERARDSLITALQHPYTEEDFDSPELASLTKRVEQMIVQRQFDLAEVERHLGPPLQSTDIGSVGRFRLVEFLAKGGMGIVFRAIDPQLDRTVCIKLLNPRFKFQTEAKARFVRESQEMACLQSQRIVPVLEVGEQQGLPFFVMPMLQGMTMRRMLQQQHKLDAATALRLTRQTAEGLQSAHQRGLLHRDIKPDNLWITETGDVKILDFGLARVDDATVPITRSGTVIGTPSYMSPEQVTGKPLDPRTDLFSLGVVLVEMLTGDSPFERPNLFSTLMSVAGDTFEVETVDPQQQIDPGIRSLISRLLTKQPDQRIESAERLIEEIRQLEAGRQHATPEPIGRGGPVRGGPARWGRLILSGLAGAAVCLAMLAIYFATDKGTLVVKTSDPQVEVTIANQTVKIFDPLTQRRFEIRIGQVALPTGVYQLEASDASGDLVFSSQSIAIRRGERTIVEVELKPEFDKRPAVASSDTPRKPATVNSDAMIDTSFAPEVRERFPALLKSLPALPLTEFTSGPLSPAGAVRNPAPLSNFDNWSIEPTIDSLDSWQANSNGTCFSHSADDGYLRIFGQAGSLKYLLPSPGVILDSQWDTHVPNLIAFASYLPDGNQEAQGSALITIYVWRLNQNDSGGKAGSEEDAELLYRIPASATGFAWDHGYRIAYVHEKKLCFFRLDTGTSISLPIDAVGRLGSRAVSSDGQFVSLRGRAGDASAVNIWNLHTGKFHYAIIGASRGFWSDSRNHFALQRWAPDKLHYEIWDIEAKKLAREIELPYREERGEKLRPRGSSLDRSLTRLAWVNRAGTLYVRNMENNREGNANVADLFDVSTKSTVGLSWTVDGNLAISTRGTIAKWTPGNSIVDGTVKRLSANNSSYVALDDRDFSIATAAFNASNIGSIRWRFQVQGASTALQQTRSIFDLNRLQWIELPNKELADDYLLVLSPNGQYVAALPNVRQSATVGWQIVSLQTNEVVEANRIPRMRSRSGVTGQGGRWSGDSRFFAFLTMGRSFHSAWNLYDVQNKQTLSPDVLSTKRGNPVTVANWRDWFVFVVDSTTEGFVRMVVFDPAENRVVHQIDGEYSSFSYISEFGDQLFFAAQQKGEPQARRYALAKTGDEFQVNELEIIQPDIRLLLSRDLRWASIIKSDVEIESTMRSSSRTVNYLKHVGPDRISVANWNDVLGQFPPKNMLLDQFTPSERDLVSFAGWHVSEDIFSWIVNNQLRFFDPKTRNVTQLNAPVLAVSNMPFGWLTASGRRILALDPAGRYLGQVRFWKKSSAPIPAVARWISSDGSLLSSDDGQGLSLVFIQDGKVHTRPYADIADSELKILPVEKKNPLVGDAYRH